MKPNERRFLITNHDFGLEMQLHMMERVEGVARLAQEVVFKEKEGVYPPPMLTFQDGEATMLMDQLWIAGIRPSKRIVEPQNTDHMNGEIKWLRETADHLMKKP